MSLPADITSEQNTTIKTRVHWAVDRLKEKFPAAESHADLETHCWPAGQFTDKMLVFWNFWVRKHPKINYDQATNTFTFRPMHNISSGPALVAFLRNQKGANGLQVKDLKDGWTDVEAIIDELESRHEVLVSRNKKDSKARIVWADSPDCYSDIDQEFVDAWKAIPLPDPEDTIKELGKGGYKSAGAIKVQPIIAPTERKKARATRQGKTTNKHMAGIFKDYSHKRATAGK